MVARFVNCAVVLKTSRTDDSPELSANLEACFSASIAAVILTLIAFLFGMFTACMSLDQLDTIRTGQSAIDRYKGERHAAVSDEHEVFGGTKALRLDWFLPTKPVFPPDALQIILGYRCFMSSLCI